MYFSNTCFSSSWGNVTKIPALGERQGNIFTSEGENPALGRLLSVFALRPMLASSYQP